MPNAPSETPSKTGDLHVDPDDRAEYFSAVRPGWGLPVVAYFHDPSTWHAPLLVSAGPDGQLGIFEPDIKEGATTPAGVPPALPNLPVQRAGLAFPITGQQEALFDNLTNHNASGGL